MEFKTQIYKEAQQTQTKVYDLQKVESKRHSEKKNEIYFKYSNLERELNSKKYAEEREAEAQHDKEKEALKNQLESANKLNVPFVLIIGQKELQDGTIIVRDMESGVQEIIDQQKIESHLKKKLKKK